VRPGQSVRYDAEHTLGIGQDVVVPETQNMVAVRIDDSTARRIGRFLMLPAIRLDHELRAITGEIDDELADRNLPAKARFREAFAQYAPQLLLGVGSIATQSAGEDGR
jgi:hypothetical protein